MIETQVTTGLTLRAGRPEDAENCGSICYEAFKAIADLHNFPPDFSSSEVAIGSVATVARRHLLGRGRS